MLSSEQIFDITCETKEQMTKIITFLLDYADTNINDFYIANDNTLVLCHNYDSSNAKYPFVANPTIITEHAIQHFDNIDLVNKNLLRGLPPDIDGTIAEGFRIFCPNYTNNEHFIEPYKTFYNPIFAIRPAWIIYAK